MNPNELLATEAEIERLWNEGELPFLTHLAGGNEQFLCDFFQSNIKPTDFVLASHRCHFHYLLHGGLNLVEKVKAGKSMFLYAPRFLNSAIVAGTCGIAAGLALSIQRRGGSERVWCFVGDGATEQGGFYEAVRFVEGRDLPVTFIVEDNNSSCGVTKEQRGIKSFQWPACVVEYRYAPTHPHAGNGSRPVLKQQ